MTWRYSEGNRHRVAIFLSLFTISGTIDILVRPYIWSLIFNFIQRNGITRAGLPQLWWFLACLFLVNLAFWMFHGPARVLERTNAYRAHLKYMHFLLRGVMALPLEWHSDHPSGDTIDKVKKGSDALFNFSKDSFRILYEVINLIGSVSVLSWFFPLSGVLMFVLLGGCGLVMVRFDKVLIDQYRQISRMQNLMAASVFDAISNITTVIILRVEQLVFTGVVHKSERPVSLFLKNNIINEIKWFLANTGCVTLIVVVLACYIYQESGRSEGVLAGSIFLLYRYLDRVASVFSSFAILYGEIVQNRAHVMNAEELSTHFVPEGLTNHVLPKDWSTISIQGLSFSYNDGADPKMDIDDVSLTISRGARIALVGKSGCGKTTFMKLMRGLYKPSSLSLLVDGHRIEGGFDGVARGISLIPQSPEVFNASVMINITLGAEHDLGTIYQCVDMALFTETLRRLPRGLDSQMSEKGVNLSGGQMQRLALARGLLASLDKSLILLDEPTSSLDASTERRIYQNVLQRFRDATVISSIHRLHLLPMFDTVCFFDGGRIVAQGSFSELMDSCREFRELYTHYRLTEGEAG